MNFYRNESSDAKWNAQRNLSGRTHYADDDTLRAFRSRILSSGDHDNGLIFSIIESMSLDYNHTRRGFRFVLFDIFGTVISRCDLEHAFTSKEQARKAMYAELNKIDAYALTAEAIDRAERRHKDEMDRLRADLAALQVKKAS